MSEFDLTNFGLHWSLEPKKNIVMPEDFRTKIAKIKYNPESNKYVFFSQEGKEYMRLERKNFLSGGTYGNVYECAPIKNIRTIMKEVQCREKAKLENIIKEAIIQIIIVKETESINLQDAKIIGPFAPYIYCIGYDPDENKCYILSDKMEETLSNLVDEIQYMNLSAREKEIMIISLLKKIMLMLAILWEILGLNHRDLKLNNVMYKKTIYCAMDPVLIDFGFSCVNYEGLWINANDKFHRKYIESRDPTKLIYSLAKYNKDSLSANFYEACRAILTWKRQGKVCSLLDNDCGVQGWRNTYHYVNTLSEQNPNGSPSVIINVLDAIKDVRSWKKELPEYNKLTSKKKSRKIRKGKHRTNFPLTHKVYNSSKTL